MNQEKLYLKPKLQANRINSSSVSRLICNSVMNVFFRDTKYVETQM